MAFLDSRLPFGSNTPKSEVTFTYDTLVLLNSGYQEQRSPRRSEYLAEIDIKQIIFNSTELDAFILFFEQLQGKLNTFRYQLPCDCYAQSRQQGIDRDLTDHTSQIGIVRTYGAAVAVDSDRYLVSSGNSSLWQLVKVYEFDDGTDKSIGIKTITKPVDSTVVLWDDTNTQLLNGTDFTYDATTGIVTTTASYPATRFLDSQFEFDIEVRLDVDEIPQVLLVSGANSGGTWSYETCQTFEISNLQLMEIADYKIPKISALYTLFSATQPTSAISSLVLDYDYKPIETITKAFQTRIERLVNRFENRLSYTEDNRFSIAFESSVLRNCPLNQDKQFEQRLYTAEYVVAVFNICWGRLRNLNVLTFYNPSSVGNQATQLVRFDTDALTLNLLKSDADSASFEVAELDFIESKSAAIAGLNTACAIVAIDNAQVTGQETANTYQDTNGTPITSDPQLPITNTNSNIASRYLSVVQLDSTNHLYLGYLLDDIFVLAPTSSVTSPVVYTYLYPNLSYKLYIIGSINYATYSSASGSYRVTGRDVAYTIKGEGLLYSTATDTLDTTVPTVSNTTSGGDTTQTNTFKSRLPSPNKPYNDVIDGATLDFLTTRIVHGFDNSFNAFGEITYRDTGATQTDYHDYSNIVAVCNPSTVGNTTDSTIVNTTASSNSLTRNNSLDTYQYQYYDQNNLISGTHTVQVTNETTSTTPTIVQTQIQTNTCVVDNEGGSVGDLYRWANNVYDLTITSSGSSQTTTTTGTTVTKELPFRVTSSGSVTVKDNSVDSTTIITTTTPPPSYRSSTFATTTGADYSRTIVREKTTDQLTVDIILAGEEGSVALYHQTETKSTDNLNSTQVADQTVYSQINPVTLAGTTHEHRLKLNSTRVTNNYAIDSYIFQEGTTPTTLSLEKTVWIQQSFSSGSAGYSALAAEAYPATVNILGITRRDSEFITTTRTEESYAGSATFAPLPSNTVNFSTSSPATSPWAWTATTDILIGEPIYALLNVGGTYYRYSGTVTAHSTGNNTGIAERVETTLHTWSFEFTSRTRQDFSFASLITGNWLYVYPQANALLAIEAIPNDDLVKYGRWYKHTDGSHYLIISQPSPSSPTAYVDVFQLVGNQIRHLGTQDSQAYPIPGNSPVNYSGQPTSGLPLSFAP